MDNFFVFNLYIVYGMPIICYVFCKKFNQHYAHKVSSFEYV